MKKKWILLIACMGFLYMLSGCQQNAVTEKSQTGFYFDTVITLQISSAQSEQLLTDGMAICAELEQIFSRTLPDSELYAINNRTTNKLTVSDEMAYVIGEGLKYYQLSDKALDITIAPVLELWDFKAADPVVPDQAAISREVVKTDAAKIHLNGNELTFDNSDIQIDLGALVKGYAADRLKAYLTAAGVESGIINLGGNVLTIGRKTDGEMWTVGIQLPFSPRNETITTVMAAGDSVVSAGVYERCFELDERLYHHIINPQTGYPMETDLWQATIISESSLMGDALSTICILKGRAAAEKMIAGIEGVSAIFVTDQGELIE